jgi:type II secretory pathway pseudopilin PulG
VRFHARSNQSGFALIEVIASAAVLGLVTIAVYGGYNATLGSSGRERARAVAASLAEQDQERLRSFRPTDLATYAAPPQIIKVPPVTGVSYKVTSTVDWISDSADGSSTCTSEANLEDYLRITSTVTSGIIGTETKPVVQRSLVAPPVGTFRQGLGSLVVRVTGKGSLPITGLPVKIVGATTVTDDTNSFGCAVFRYVPVGSYAVSFSRPGYVNTSGVNLATASATVSEGTLNVIQQSYDRGASIIATFDTQYRGTTCTPPACPASRATSVSLESSDIPAPGILKYPAGATNQTATSASFTTPLLYPFDNPYGLYAGNCADANPTKLVAPPVAVSPTFAKAPGGLLPGELLYAAKVRQPALNVRVVQGAAVPVMGKRITAQPIQTGTTCGATATPPGLTYVMTGFTGTGVLDANAGWASKLGTTGNFDPGLPYGKYDICLDNSPITPSSARRRTKPGTVTVDLNSPAGSTPVKTVDLAIAANVNTGSTAICP